MSDNKIYYVNFALPLDPSVFLGGMVHALS